MKNNTALKICLCIIAAVFIVHQLYSSFYKPISTASAEYYTTADGLQITGIMIRNESVVENSAGGVLHFVAGDGSRVSKNGIIASIYDSQAASLTVTEMESVQQKIADIQDIQSCNNLEAADLDLLNTKVNDELNMLIQKCSYGKYDNVGEYTKSLLSSLNRRQMATGVTTDFSNELNQLNSQLNTLNSSLPSPKGYINANQSGYFVSSVDGYENTFDCNDLAKVTPEAIKNMKPNDTTDTTIGKIVSDYEWYIAAKVTINESLKYKEGDMLTIKTDIKSSPMLSVSVKKINISENGTDAVIVFSCDQMNSELASIRSGPMTVISAEYSGLKVPKSGLRVQDSQTGVYVLSGMKLKFVPVNVIYSNDSFIICEKKTTTETALRLYDEVVVKGKNLYDGKIVS